MELDSAVEAEAEQDTLVAFVKACLDVDDATIVDINKSSIAPEVYDAGWDRFAIGWELDAKRRIVEGYEEAARVLREVEADAAAASRTRGIAQGRYEEASRTFLAVAITYRGRYGYGRAKRDSAVAQAEVAL